MRIGSLRLQEKRTAHFVYSYKWIAASTLRIVRCLFFFGVHSHSVAKLALAKGSLAEPLRLRPHCCRSEKKKKKKKSEQLGLCRQTDRKIQRMGKSVAGLLFWALLIWRFDGKAR